jgi:NAD(P)-dependent dehydrogenase (short-subunit alcohol dehydrogenase family)
VNTFADDAREGRNSGSHAGGSPTIDVLADVSPELVEELHLDRVPFDRLSRHTADMLRLDGVRAIVTGGGGNGLGYATCHRLAEQGARVAVFDIVEGLAEQTAAELRDRWGAEAIAVACDVGDPASVASGVEVVADAFGGLDLLVNNAGGSGSIGATGSKARQHSQFASMPVDDIDTVVRVNLLGVLLMTQAALSVMLPAGAGRIVNVASEGGKIGMDELAVYSCCKAAVIAFTRNMAHEVGSLGVSTVAVCPGIMVSDRTLRTLSGGSSIAADVLRRGFSRVTIGRCSVPDEVASVIAFLASDAGSYVHGTAVSVGGGMAD